MDPISGPGIVGIPALCIRGELLMSAKSARTQGLEASPRVFLNLIL